MEGVLATTLRRDDDVKQAVVVEVERRCAPTPLRVDRASRSGLVEVGVSALIHVEIVAADRRDVEVPVAVFIPVRDSRPHFGRVVCRAGTDGEVGERGPVVVDVVATRSKVPDEDQFGVAVAVHVAPTRSEADDVRDAAEHAGHIRERVAVVAVDVISVRADPAGDTQVEVAVEIEIAKGSAPAVRGGGGRSCDSHRSRLVGERAVAVVVVELVKANLIGAGGSEARDEQVEVAVAVVVADCRSRAAVREVDSPTGSLIGECSVLVVDEQAIGAAATNRNEDINPAVVVEVADRAAGCEIAEVVRAVIHGETTRSGRIGEGRLRGCAAGECEGERDEREREGALIHVEAPEARLDAGMSPVLTKDPTSRVRQVSRSGLTFTRGLAQTGDFAPLEVECDPPHLVAVRVKD